MAVGMRPSGQPSAGAIFTVGIRLFLGCGRVGLAPMPASGGNRAVSPQATRPPTMAAQTEAASQALAGEPGERINFPLDAARHTSAHVHCALRTLRGVSAGRA